MFLNVGQISGTSNFTDFMYTISFLGTLSIAKYAYLVKLVECCSLLLAATPANRTNIEHTISKFNKCSPVFDQNRANKTINLFIA